ncbi:MAG: AlpA family phage regulatory protein [Magnetococcales bacterium]|nr:AlpA family phage regulatory protein [Magnetococcales bacterium]
MHKEYPPAPVKRLNFANGQPIEFVTQAPSIPISCTPISRVLRRTEVMMLLGIKSSTLGDWVAKGHLPPPIQLGPRNVGWREDVIAAWLESRLPTKAVQQTIPQADTPSVRRGRPRKSAANLAQ